MGVSNGIDDFTYHFTITITSITHILEYLFSPTSHHKVGRIQTTLKTMLAHEPPLDHMPNTTAHPPLEVLFRH